MILPRPGDGFEWRETPVAPVLVCRALEAVAPHVFTTRGFTLGVTRTGDAPWDEVRSVIGAESLRRLHQVHGNAVAHADDPHWSGHPHADIVVGSVTGRAIAVQGADCVPLLIADVRLGVVAAAHAGWRGLAQAVPAQTVRALAGTYGSQPRDLIAAIGPSVGACCYEVGPDVRQAFEAGGFTRTQLDRWFSPAPRPTENNRSMEGLPSHLRDGHAYFDGWVSAAEQLREAGVPPDSIFTARLCTASHPALLCSYRRDRSYAGRIAGVIVPRPDRR